MCNQHGATQVEPRHQFGQRAVVPGQRVRGFLLGLVTAAESDQVGHDHAVAGSQPDRQHVPEQVAPAAGAVQAQPGAGRIARPLVQVVHAQARQGRQVADVARGPGPVRQAGKARVRRAQRVVPQGMGGARMGAPGLAPRLEEAAQQRAALLRQNAALDARMVVQCRLREQVHHRTRRAGLGVGGAVHHPVQPGVQHGAAAHGAGLQRHVQRAAVEPVVAQAPGRGPQRHDLRMCRGIVAGDGRIAAPCYQFAAADHHRAHGNLAARGGLCRFLQRDPHPGLVGLAVRSTGNGARPLVR